MGPLFVKNCTCTTLLDYGSLHIIHTKDHNIYCSVFNRFQIYIFIHLESRSWIPHNLKWNLKFLFLF